RIVDRMGVALRRRPVGGPAGVAEAMAAGERLLFEQIAQAVELAFGLDGGELAVLADHHHSGGVVAAIFEALEAIDEQRHDLAIADVSNDSTHGGDFSLADSRPRRRLGPALLV